MSSYIIKQFTSTANERGVPAPPAEERLYLLPASSGFFAKTRKRKTAKSIVILLAAALLGVFLMASAEADETVYNPAQVLEDKQAGLCFEPVTGLVRDRYSTGSVKRETPYKRGVRQGLERQWYSNTALMQESAYDEGKRHGLTRIYYPSGSLMDEIPYDNGQMHGLRKQFYETGALMSEKFYLKGKGVEEGGEGKYYEHAEAMRETSQQTGGRQCGTQHTWSEENKFVMGVPYACGTRDGAGTRQPEADCALEGCGADDVLFVTSDGATVERFLGTQGRGITGRYPVVAR